MNGYVCFYNGKKISVHAETLFQAKQMAVKSMKVRRNQEHMMSVVLAEKEGEQVTHKPDF